MKTRFGSETCDDCGHVDCACSKVRERLRERDAQCAEMRAALEHLLRWFMVRSPRYLDQARWCEDALSSDAAKALLDELQKLRVVTNSVTKLEAENEKLRAVRDAAERAVKPLPWLGANWRLDLEALRAALDAAKATK